MKTSTGSAKTNRRDDDFYRAFLQLDRDHRRDVTLRILRNQKVLADLYDHFLIQRSLREPGRNVAWGEYLHVSSSRAS